MGVEGIQGFHHVTALAGDPWGNLGFYMLPDWLAPQRGEIERALPPLEVS